MSELILKGRAITVAAHAFGVYLGEISKGFAWGLGFLAGITVWAHISVYFGLLPFSQ